jgi:phosphoribosylaminoimidazole-succinocarboxamide synthase
MPRVTITVEGEPEEARVALMKLLGIEPDPNSGIHHGEAGWTEEEMARFWGLLRPGARRILTEVAKWPDGYGLENLKRVLELTGQEIGGQKSSIGHAMRQFEGKPYPIQFDGYNYRMDGDFAAWIREGDPMTTAVLLETPLPNVAHRGKVRDLYDLGDRLLIVATDRISAFDVVLPTGVPGKGAVLTQISAFWFGRTEDVVPNHFLRLADGTSDDDLPFSLPPELIGRSTIVRKAERLPVECIVRGYMAGSAWAEYQKQGTVCGVRMPPGMQESEPFPEPLFTPTTKADVGHDENLTTEEFVSLIGVETANALRLRSLALYKYGAQYARERGIIIADTKFEFGILDGEPIVIDEILTPDSSRFWEASEHRPGRHQEAFDKQYVRDWLLQSGWDREPPGPELPADVVDETARLYREVYRRLTGEEARV